METMEDFKAELEASFRKINEGDMITGTAIAVSEEEITLDLKYYAQGIIKVEDFSNDPDLALQLATAIKVKRNDMQLNVDCLFDEAMLKKAGEYLNNPANGELIERAFKGLKR